ncbi:fibronectin type III domain-containing protein [Orenia marismortui]|uniref:hypothetical protein n=1 Tax=Orenia marismortui TaxID=46469 RepID=UPI00035C602C|nr:hypothetical protein [Orenia marismortui]
MKLLESKRGLILILLTVVCLLFVGCSNDDTEDISHGDEYLKVSFTLPGSKAQIASLGDSLNKVKVTIVNTEDDSDKQEDSKKIENINEDVVFSFSDLKIGAKYNVIVEGYEVVEGDKEYCIYKGSQISDQIAEEEITLVDVKVNLTDSEGLVLITDKPNDYVSAKAVLLPEDNGLETDFVEREDAKLKAEFGAIPAGTYSIGISWNGAEELEIVKEHFDLLAGRVTTLLLSINDEGSLDIDVDWDTAPPVPSNLVAVYSDTGVDLTWDSVEGADGYLLFRGDSSDKYDRILTTKLITENSYTDALKIDPTTADKYYYWIQAYREGLGSDLSEPVAPSEPGKLELNIQQPVDNNANKITDVTIEYKEESASSYTEISVGTIEVEAGTYIVRASKAGYQTWKESVEVVEQSVTVSPVLNKEVISKYNLTIAQPVDGDGNKLSGVRIEYKEASASSYTEISVGTIEVEAGDYLLRASKEGYRSWSKSVTIDDDTSLNPKLTEQNGPVNGYYATNPNGQVGQYKTITDLSDWTEDMKIVQGVIADTPRSWRGYHEIPDPDLYALFAAWDDENLYLMVEIPNIDEADTIDHDASFAGSQFLPMGWVLNTGKRVSGTGLMVNGNNVWCQDKFFEFQGGVDTLIMHHPRLGVGEPGLFFTDDNGEFSYEEGEYLFSFPNAGIERDVYFNESISEKMWAAVVPGEGMAGLGGKDSTDMSTYDYIDVKAEGKKASAYQITIPLVSLEIDRNYLETTGISVAVFSTFGESIMDVLPWDPTMIDNAKEPYGPDSSTSFEKEDYDNITASMARVGN